MHVQMLEVIDKLPCLIIIHLSRSCAKMIMFSGEVHTVFVKPMKIIILKPYQKIRRSNVSFLYSCLDFCQVPFIDIVNLSPTYAYIACLKIHVELCTYETP